MMILSRIWYVVLAVVAAVSFYLVSLAVGQYNRQVSSASDEELKGDTQVVNWALQIDARRRLDSLILGSVDENVKKALKAANGKEPVPAPSRDEGKKGISAVNEKLPADYKFDALFVVDREGRVIAQTGFDAATSDFELGGYPAVFDGLHGFLRDDTWVLDNRIVRVVVRPVEDEVGQPPLGAVVGFKNVDTDFCRELAKRTRANVAFFTNGNRVAQGAQEGFGAGAFDDLSGELSKLATDDAFKASGRTDVRPLGPKKDASAIFSRLPGDAGEAGAGYAVVRQKVLMSSFTGFLSNADDSDKKNVSYIAIGGILLVGIVLGILFSFLEHSRPMGELKRQGERLRRGEIDALQLPRLSSGFRTIAQDVNFGIERIVEKGGGAVRKPADLESILGPVPAQPQMSAFSFPLPEPSTVGPLGAGGGNGAPGFPQAAPSGAQMMPSPAASAPRMAPPPPKAPPPIGSSPQMGNIKPPVPKSAPQFADLAPAPSLESLASEPEEEQTRVGAAPPGLLDAAAGSTPPPPGPPGGLGMATPAAGVPITRDVKPASSSGDPPEWKGVFEEFVKTKRQCGEPVDGLTYEKFRGTLSKNRDALMQRHNCTRVKFTVYVKDGRASLKATPVRD